MRHDSCWLACTPCLPAGSDVKKRFVKRGDLEAMRLEKERLERLEKEQERKRRLGDGVVATTDDGGESAPMLAELPVDEVIRRLRKLRKPVTLFGEDAAARLARLRVHEDEEHDDLALHGGHDIVRGFTSRVLACVCFQRLYLTP